jgi:hypothetical protein
VFISYARADKRIADVIHRDLTRADFRVWRDTAAIGAGARLRSSIEDGIRGSASVVIIVSIRSLSSQWVLNELDAAMLREIRERRTVVIPVVIGRIATEALPSDLQARLFIDLRYSFESRYRKHRSQLHAAIATARIEPAVGKSGSISSATS